MKIRDHLSRLLYVLSAGYIFFFFSERLFWARWRPQTDNPKDQIITWLVYSLLTYITLLLAQTFYARRIWAWFLAGALYGWLGEGVVVDTMYKQFPLQISWTGLAWHALITVLFGWVWMRRALAGDSFIRCLAGTLALGLFWGCWGIFWRFEPAEPAIAPAAFARYAATTGFLLIAAYGLCGWLQPERLKAGRPTGIILGALVLVFFLAVRVPAQPGAPLVLPPLAGLTLYALWRHRQWVARAVPEPEIIARPNLRNLAALLFTPFTAAMTYLLLWRLNARLPSNIIVYLVTMPAGFILYVLSIWKILRRPDKNSGAAKQTVVSY